MSKTKKVLALLMASMLTAASMQGARMIRHPGEVPATEAMARKVRRR